MLFDLPKDEPSIIKIIGVGGGGSNAVTHMYKQGIIGVDYAICNTDAQAMHLSPVPIKIPLGASLTEGRGAGSKPDVGKRACMESLEEITRFLDDGTKMAFITAGMGGGTGTGAAPIVAQVAKQMNILTVAVVTKPFPFEGQRRMRVASEGIEELAKNVDSLIIIPNEKLLAVLGKEMSLLNAFSVANDVLYNATQGVAELITGQGLMNVDFADVKTVMANMGMAMMGMGSATGQNRAREATEKAIKSPLLADINLAGAKGVLVNITAGLNLSIGEFDEVGNTIRDFTDDDATLVVGTVIDPSMQEELRVTVVATGLGQSKSTVQQRPGAHGEEPAIRLVPTERPDPSTPDYTTLDIPPGLRKGRPGRAAADRGGEQDMDYLDIPAFLRRQAD